MRRGDVVYFLHTDHLGSASLTTDITGTLVAETRYLPYGEERWITGTLVTDFTFTGQRAERGFGLLDYNARYYDPWLGRFVSADSVVPQAGNPQALNRYAYVTNNPLRYDDPSGHCPMCVAAVGGALIGATVGAVMEAGPKVIQNIQTGQPLTANIDPSAVAKAAAVGAMSGLVAGATFGAGTLLMGSGLAASVATGAVSGVASGQASRAAENALNGRDVTEGLGNPTDVLTDAALGAVGGAAGYGIRRFAARRLLQQVTNAANETLTENPQLAQTVLRGGEYAAGQRSPGLAKMQYGNAVERLTGETVQGSPVLSRLYSYASQPGRRTPDFVGRGLFKGTKLDITTNTARSIADHLSRPYGRGLILILYERPPNFTGFP